MWYLVRYSINEGTGFEDPSPAVRSRPSPGSNDDLSPQERGEVRAGCNSVQLCEMDRFSPLPAPAGRGRLCSDDEIVGTQAGEGSCSLICGAKYPAIFSGALLGVLGLTLAFAAEPDDGLAKKMLPIYVKEAEAYALAVESAADETARAQERANLRMGQPDSQRRPTGRTVPVVARRSARRPHLYLLVATRQVAGPTNRPRVSRTRLRETARDSTKGVLNEWKPEKGLERAELPGCADAGRDRRRAGLATAQTRPGFQRSRSRQRRQALGPATVAGPALPLSLRRRRRCALRPGSPTPGPTPKSSS